MDVSCDVLRSLWIQQVIHFNSMSMYRLEVFKEWTQKHPKPQPPHFSQAFCEESTLSMCLCREKPRLQRSIESVSKSIEKSSFTARKCSQSDRRQLSSCFPFTQGHNEHHMLWCVPAVWAATAQNLSCTKGHFSWGPSHSRPPKKPKNPTHFWDNTRVRTVSHQKLQNLSQENMHLKDSFDESLWCFTCFCWWGFGGKNVKMLQGLPRKEAGAHHKRMLCPLHLGHPQTANCQFRKLDIRQFLLCPQMGHVVFFRQDQWKCLAFLKFCK